MFKKLFGKEAQSPSKGVLDAAASVAPSLSHNNSQSELEPAQLPQGVIAACLL